MYNSILLKFSQKITNYINLIVNKNQKTFEIIGIHFFWPTPSPILERVNANISNRPNIPCSVIFGQFGVPLFNGGTRKVKKSSIFSTFVIFFFNFRKYVEILDYLKKRCDLKKSFIAIVNYLIFKILIFKILS